MFLFISVQTGNYFFEQKFKDIFTPILPKGKLVLPTKTGSCNIEDENFRHVCRELT